MNCGDNVQASALDSERRAVRQHSADLKARGLLNRLAYQVIQDGEASTLLLHAQIYLADRDGYRAVRLAIN